MVLVPLFVWLLGMGLVLEMGAMMDSVKELMLEKVWERGLEKLLQSL